MPRKTFSTIGTQLCVLRLKMKRKPGSHSWFHIRGILFHTSLKFPVSFTITQNKINIKQNKYRNETPTQEMMKI